ncbi:MAG: transketolase C-terminal domain-containing protein [Candidatus Omnitrophota bacterium]
MRNDYLEQLYDLAKDNKDILALVSDNGAIVYDKFCRSFPEQFINFGISEANMISVAAGLASCGKIPFTYTISCFLTMRAFEQVRNDVCLQKMNVKLVGIGGGFIYSNLGPTHHATEDIALMRVLPNMTIFSPADGLEARKVTSAAAAINGPVYIRLATGSGPVVYTRDYDFQVGKGVILHEGEDVAIITTGGIVHEVLKAVDELERKGISPLLINIPTIKPIDKEIIIQVASRAKAILTVEEHSIIGGLGSAVAEVISEESSDRVIFKRMGLKGVFPSGYGSYQEMKEMNGLSCGHIVEETESLCRDKKERKLKDLVER